MKMYEPITIEDYRTSRFSNGFIGKLDLAELIPLRTAIEKVHIHIIYTIRIGDIYTYQINNGV